MVWDLGGNLRQPLKLGLSLRRIIISTISFFGIGYIFAPNQDKNEATKAKLVVYETLFTQLPEAFRIERNGWLVYVLAIFYGQFEKLGGRYVGKNPKWAISE